MGIKNKTELVGLTKARIDSFDQFIEFRHRKMRDWFHLYTGEIFARDGTIESDLYYDVKLVYSIIQGFIPSILVADPDIILKPRKEQSVEITKLVEIVANYYWRELKIKPELKKALLDTFIYGFSVLKTGWVTRFKSRDIKVDSADPGEQKDFSMNEYVQEDNPFMVRVSPFLFMWDPQARNLNEARWVGEKLIRPYEEVKNNKAYDKKALDELMPTNFAAQDFIFEDGQMYSTLEDSPDKYVMLYEIHDKERELLITLAHGVETPLRIIPYPYPTVEGTHYGMLVINEIPDQVLGLSLPQLLWDQQMTLNRIRTLQANHARRAARIFAVDLASGIKKEDVENLQQASDGSVVFTNGDPDQIKLIQTNPLPQELFAIGDIARGDMLQTAGSPPHRFGMPAGGRTSATEIQSMNTAEEFRIEDARAEVEDFSANMTKKMIQIMANKLSDDKVIMIAGEDNFVPFKFSKRDLQGEFDFTIDAGSMVRQNRDIERQQLMQFLNMAAQIPGVNAMEIIKRIAKTFNWKQLDKLFAAPPQLPQAGGPLDGQGEQVSPNPPSPADMISSPGAGDTNEN